MELKLFMQVATSDVLSYPYSPRVHIFVEDEEFGIVSLEGELLEGDLGETLSNYVYQGLEEHGEELRAEWNELLMESGL